MIYTFAVLQNPLKAVPEQPSAHGHYFGGELGASLGLEAPRFARIMTLDLQDPMLGFLRFPGHCEVPLLMDMEGGWISYVILGNGSIELHRPSDSRPETLLHEQAIPKTPFSLKAIPYDEYRAAVFAQSVFQDYLRPEDKASLDHLGESYTQVGGHHSRAQAYQPYCGNSKCDGHGTQVMILLATIAQVPAPDVSLEFLPYDPAIEFSFCQNCHSIQGSIVAD